MALPPGWRALAHRLGSTFAATLAENVAPRVSLRRTLLYGGAEHLAVRGLLTLPPAAEDPSISSQHRVAILEARAGDQPNAILHASAPATYDPIRCTVGS